MAWFIGPRERAAGVGPIVPDLALVYDADGVQIYRGALVGTRGRPGGAGFSCSGAAVAREVGGRFRGPL